MRTREALVALILVARAAALSAGGPAGDPNDLALSMELAHTQYALGSPVHYKVSLCNPTAEAIAVLEGGCTCEVPRTAVRDGRGAIVAFETCDGCGGGIILRTWETGQCTFWNGMWNQRLGRYYPGQTDPQAPLAPPGRYTFRVNYEFFSAGFIHGESASFVVGEPIAVPTLAPWSAALLASLLALLALRQLSGN